MGFDCDQMEWGENRPTSKLQLPGWTVAGKPGTERGGGIPEIMMQGDEVIYSLQGGKYP